MIKGFINVSEKTDKGERAMLINVAQIVCIQTEGGGCRIVLANGGLAIVQELLADVVEAIRRAS